MAESTLLWIDLRYNKSSVCTGKHLADAYRIEVVTDRDQLEKAIERVKPFTLCFEFDFPDSEGLDMLQEIKSQFPDLPILMLSEEKTVELALWALRARVWNYFIKPIAIEHIVSSIDILATHHQSKIAQRRRNVMPPPLVPHETRLSRNKSNKPNTVPALEYVKQHCHEKITLDEMASICSMSKSHFSRKFKLEYGYTFQEFLVMQRLVRAKQMLENSDASIIEVALAVGFSDHSNFTRAFQKYLGVSPSRYRSVSLSVSF